jgi:hypothetical protein
VSVPWPHGDPRAVAQAIVADPRFHGSTTSAAVPSTLWERALRWIGARLHDLFAAVGHVLGTRSPLNLAVGILVLLVAAAGIVALIVLVARLPGRRHAAAAAGTRPLPYAPTSAELIALAHAAARAERWHEAASALARAALRALDERGRLRFDPARTPGEARRVLHDPTFDAFEREATTALFAAGAATPERYARLRAAYAGAFGEPV